MPRARSLIPVLLVAGAVAATAAPAGAAKRFEDSYASPTGDYAQSVYRLDGVRYLEFATFSLRGKLRLCVTTPDGERTCKRRTLREDDKGILVTKTRWSKHFPRGGRGTYRVRFSQGSFRAPVMKFRVG